MVEGKYSLTSQLPVPKQPTAVTGENPVILQAGVKIHNLHRTAKVKYRGNKAATWTGEGNRLWPLAEDGGVDTCPCLRAAMATTPEHIPKTTP